MLPHRVRFGRFELQPAERRLLIAGQPATLGARAFDVLLALVAQHGRVVGKGDILQAAWPGMVVEENNLAVQISALRKLLGTELIKTVAGRGYQFTAEGLAVVPAAANETVVAAGPVPPNAENALMAAAPGPALIGRHDELQQLTALLGRHRLVTLVGAGGIGKTTLADAWLRLQPAGRAAWVELATLADVSELPAAVLAALQLPAGTELPAALAPLGLTLVLDNAEPLAAALAPLVRQWLQGAPGLRLLVTSQVPLRLQAEQVFRLGALQLPDERVNPAQALACASVALFVDRVQAAEPSFELSAGNVAAVVDICRRLDGLPLALELAAARVPALGLSALCAALDERLRVLGGNRAAPARQRTLRAALEWTHSLLDPGAQAVFRYLGHFSGGFTLADAQAGCAQAQPPIAALDVLDALAALVDGSLLNVDGAEPPRYLLPESARLFALELLQGQSPQAAAEPASEAAQRLLQRLPQAGLDPLGGMAHDTVMALARRFRPDDVRNLDSALKELTRAVDIASQVVADGGESATDAFVGEVLAAVSEQTRVGDFDAGTDAVDEALAELERREAQQRAALLRSRRALLEAGVQQDLLRRDAFAVARRIETLTALDGDSRPAWAAPFLAREAEYLREGKDQGNNLSLAVAVEMARRRLAAADTADERRAAGQMLGLALSTQGDRESGTASLLEAVEVCRNALSACDRLQAPLEWAALQHQLGDALRMLALRENSASLLEESLQYTQDALKERTRDRVPLDWAASQHALGNTLRCLAARDRGSVRFPAAVRALRAALMERTRVRTPLDWARTQNMLGITLSLWARREGSMARHHEAVSAYREALKEVTRANAPHDWAQLQNNLGIQLSTIGELTGDLATLQASVVAYREALKEQTRDVAPPYWATTQHNLGGLLRVLGEREDSVPRLRESVQAFDEALKEHTRERYPAYWAAGKNDLGLALLALGEREAGDANLREAVRVLREALQERTRDKLPIDWAGTQADLARALLALGRRQAAAGVVAQALQAASDALDVASRDAAPELHKELLQRVADAEAWLRQPSA